MKKEIVAMMKTALQAQDESESDNSGEDNSWKKRAKAKQKWYT